MEDKQRLPGSDILGYGYDATGHYADPQSVTLQIFDLGPYTETIKAPNDEIYAVQSLVKDKCAFHDISHGNYHRISGETAEEYRKSLSVKVSVSGGFGLFSASVKSHFTEEQRASFNHTFVTLYHHYDSWILSLPDISTLEMLPKAKADIEGTSGMSPKGVIHMYGTHVLVNAVIGGRARYSCFVDQSKYSSETSIEIAAEASYKGALNLDTKIETEHKEAVDSFKKSAEIKFDTLGGAFKSDFDPEKFVDWVNSFKAHPVLVDFSERSLIELYKLASTEQRRNDLQIAFEEYIKESQELVPENMPLLEVMVFNSGVKVYDDAGSGAHQDLAVYKPILDREWKWVGQTANQGSRFLIVKPLVPGAVVSPLDYEKKWDDHGSDKHYDYSLWNIVAPPEYRALGGIARLGVDNQNPPSGTEVQDLVCVHKSLCTEGKILERKWCDAGTGASWDGSVWGIGPKDENGIDAYTFYSQRSHSKPSATVYVIGKGAGVKTDES